MGRRASRLIALAVLVAAAGLAAWQIGGHYRFHDVWCFYHGGQAVLLRIDPYDPAAWRALTADQTYVVAGVVVAPPCPGAFAYPYWTAIAFAPLALLPFDVASLIWSILSLGAAALGIVWCWRAAGGDRGGIAVVYGALVIGSLPFLRLVTIGQLSGVLVALVGALALALRRERPGWAGAALGGLLLKPQLWAVLAAVLVGRGPRRGQLLVAATMVGLAFALPSLVVFPEWPLRWSAETFGHRVEMARALPSIWSLSAQLTGSLAAGAAIVAVVLGLTWALVRGRAIDTVTLAALALPFSLATAPYVYTYDHLALALTWASTCVLAARSRPAARRAILAALVLTAAIAPWVVYALTITEESDTPNALVPLLAALVLAVAIHLAPPKGETID